MISFYYSSGSGSGSGTVIHYGFGSGSDFLARDGSGSGSAGQKVTVPTVPVQVPQRCQQQSVICVAIANAILYIYSRGE